MKTVIRIQDDVSHLPHFRSLKWGRQEGVELALHKSLKSAHNPPFTGLTQEADRLMREVESVIIPSSLIPQVGEEHFPQLADRIRKPL